MNAMIATVTSTLHVFNARMGAWAEAKREEGQTTVEYLGLCALIIAIFVGVIGIASTFFDGIEGVLSSIFDKVEGLLGLF